MARAAGAVGIAHSATVAGLHPVLSSSKLSVLICSRGCAQLQCILDCAVHAPNASLLWSTHKP